MLLLQGCPGGAREHSLKSRQGIGRLSSLCPCPHACALPSLPSWLLRSKCDGREGTRGGPWPDLGVRAGVPEKLKPSLGREGTQVRTGHGNSIPGQREWYERGTGAASQYHFPPPRHSASASTKCGCHWLTLKCWDRAHWDGPAAPGWARGSPRLG